MSPRGAPARVAGALRDGAVPRRRGGALAVLASAAAGALASSAAGATLPGGGGASGWDAAVLASLAACVAAVASAGWRARPRVGWLALSLALAVPAGGLCDLLLRAMRGACPGDLAATADMAATFAALWLVAQPIRMAPPGPGRGPEERWGPF